MSNPNNPNDIEDPYEAFGLWLKQWELSHPDETRTACELAIEEYSKEFKK